MKPENRGQLVRGVVVGDFNRSCFISFDIKDVEERGNAIAYTPWHRHDDDLSILEEQLNELARLYSSFAGCQGVACCYEYKEYRK